MITTELHEKPIVFYEPCYHGQDEANTYDEYCIELYGDDLRTAEVGKTWSCLEQDRYPNRSSFWTVEFKVVYKDASGVAVLQTGDRQGTSYQLLLWVDLRR